MFFSPLSLFWKKKYAYEITMLSVCLWIPFPSTSECLNQSVWNLVCTVHHGAWGHLNGVLHKFLPSVCVSVCLSFTVARKRLGENVTAVMNTNSTIEELFDASFYMRSVSHQMKVSDSLFPEFFVLHFVDILVNLASIFNSFNTSKNDFLLIII
jgi:hypothetical protein